MKKHKGLIIICAGALLMFLIFAGLTYFVLNQHTEAIRSLQSQMASATGSYPHVTTSEAAEMVWALFFVLVPAVLLILLWNIVRAAKKSQ